MDIGSACVVEHGTIVIAELGQTAAGENTDGLGNTNADGFGNNLGTNEGRALCVGRSGDDSDNDPVNVTIQCIPPSSA